MRIIAFIAEAAPVEQILAYIGEPPRPPPITPAHGPPARDEAPEPASDCDLVVPPEPELEFDQRIAWSSQSPAGGGAEPLRLAAVAHDPDPAPARRFGLQSVGFYLAWRRHQMTPPLAATIELIDTMNPADGGALHINFLTTLGLFIATAVAEIVGCYLP